MKPESRLPQKTRNLEDTAGQDIPQGEAVWFEARMPGRRAAGPKARLRARPGESSRAFTLIEILVVLAVLGALAGLVAVAAFGTLKRAPAAVCLSNLHQLGLALGAYEQDWGDYPSHNMNALYPAYVSDPHVFVCPSSRWGAHTVYDLIRQDRKMRAAGLGNYTNPIHTYGYYPFFTTSPDFTPWPAVRRKRGPNTPLAWCNDHHPILDPARSDLYTVLTLRIDGRVEKRTYNTHNRPFFPDRY